MPLTYASKAITDLNWQLYFIHTTKVDVNWSQITTKTLFYFANSDQNGFSMSSTGEPWILSRCVNLTCVHFFRDKIHRIHAVLQYFGMFLAVNRLVVNMQIKVLDHWIVFNLELHMTEYHLEYKLSNKMAGDVRL